MRTSEKSECIRRSRFVAWPEVCDLAGDVDRVDGCAWEEEDTDCGKAGDARSDIFNLRCPMKDDASELDYRIQ